MKKNVIIIMGVCGCGKTTLGDSLAFKYSKNAYFADADDFHPQQNKDKMKNGIALTDEDRIPWLMDLHKFLIEESKYDIIILACSALKRSYRNIILNGDNSQSVTDINFYFVYLKGTYDQIYERLTNRVGHFMNIDLLQSQFDTLEEPNDDENPLVIDVNKTIVESIQIIEDKLSIFNQ